MHRNLITPLLAAALALTLSGAGIAGPREDQLSQYASAAKAADPAFAGFSAKQRAFAVRDALTGAGLTADQIELSKPQETTGGGDEREARRVEVSAQQ